MMLSATPAPRLHSHPPRRLLLLDAPVLHPYSGGTGAYSAETFLSWTEVLEAVRDACPSAVLLVDPWWQSEPGCLHAAFREILEDAPSIPVLAAVHFDESDPAAGLSLLESGVSDLVDLGVEASAEALLPTLWAVHARPLKRRVETGLPRWISMNALTLIRGAAEVAADRGGRTELARLFGVNEKTVAGWCAAEALPPPRRLLGWLRVLLGGMLLEESGRTVLNVARCAGYSYDSNLRRAMESFVGEDLGRPMREWSFDALHQAFAQELWTLREQRRDAARPRCAESARACSRRTKCNQVSPNPHLPLSGVAGSYAQPC